jgi:hypothetical protein
VTKKKKTIQTKLPNGDLPTKKGDALTSLRRKLNPKRFPGMSGKMAAIVDFVLGNSGDKRHTIDEIVEITVTSTGQILARVEHYEPDGVTFRYADIGFDEFIGDQHDFLRNWRNLLDVADLLPEERELAINLLRRRVTKGY